jgi:hypothetical protein
MLHYLILDQKLSHRRMDDDEWKDHDAQEGVHWAILKFLAIIKPYT